MAHRVLVYILFVLPQIRCTFFSTEAHGTRLWFREAHRVPVWEPDKTRLYATGVIVAEVKYNESGQVITCRFTEVRTDAEREWLYKKLEREPETIDFDKMMSIIEKCGNIINNKRGVPRFLNPIFPGTLWCGAGDTARDYETLGFYSAADSCCRNHDLCPFRALPGETSTSRGPNEVTYSDCRCDQALKQCLRENAREKYSVIAGILSLLVEVGLGSCLSENGTVVRASS